MGCGRSKYAGGKQHSSHTFNPFHRNRKRFNNELVIAASLGDLDEVNRLLDEDSSNIDTPDRDGQTPLLIATDKGRLEVSTLLLDRGSQAIDMPTNTGNTPLYTASAMGHIEVARLLIDCGSQAIDTPNKGR